MNIATICPFRNSPGGACRRASKGRLSIAEPEEGKPCETEDHDGCPRFLARVLLNARRGGGRYGSELGSK